MAEAITIAVVNRKGGVGKTTTAALVGTRVSPQGRGGGEGCY